MNIANKFNELFTATELDKFFESLWQCKKHMLMLEKLDGEYAVNHINKQAAAKMTANLDEITTPRELVMFVQLFNTELKANIPGAILDKWETGDYKVFTDKYHHRKYLNEIENHDTINSLIEKFIELSKDEYKVSGKETDNMLWMIEVYDFNDYGLYFETEEDLNKFLGEFDIASCVVFSREPGGNWFEQYSI